MGEAEEEFGRRAALIEVSTRVMIRRAHLTGLIKEAIRAGDLNAVQVKGAAAGLGAGVGGITPATSAAGRADSPTGTEPEPCPPSASASTPVTAICRGHPPDSTWTSIAAAIVSCWGAIEDTWSLIQSETARARSRGIVTDSDAAPASSETPCDAPATSSSDITPAVVTVDTPLWPADLRTGLMMGVYGHCLFQLGLTSAAVLSALGEYGPFLSALEVGMIAGGRRLDRGRWVGEVEERVRECFREMVGRVKGQQAYWRLYDRMAGVLAEAAMGFEGRVV
ncbi:hypothetical protein HK101_001886 [Irineochytrium annulatum]|nr:hypothetical protein HK101_001886 [Irineochytrium annulatum]